jgi:hypothetical protein
MVDRPASFSLIQLRSYPSRSQITQLACEEGWSYIAEWDGVPLSQMFPITEHIKHQLDPARNSQLLKDSVDVAPDGMFLNLKPYRRFAVLQPPSVPRRTLSRWRGAQD